MSHIYTGIDVLHEYDFQVLKGRRVGLLTNPSAVNNKLERTLDVLRAGVTLVSLFAPEHGIHGVRRDGEHFASGYDEVLGVYVHSVYGTHIRPTREMLDGLDVIVCDIQDVGARFYTFLWTLSYVMDAAGEYGVPVFVLDRPNPLGDTIRGPLLHPECASLVGRFPIPIQHGMTIGELARMINALWLDHPADLTVISCAGLLRSMTWDETGIPFIPPSPAMAHFVTAQHYPGSCLIEGTTFSEGRGTALPFEVIGTPGIDADQVANRLNALAFPGVRFRPHVFRPTASKHSGEDCAGIQAHIMQSRAFDPVSTWLGVIRELRHFVPDSFGWVVGENGAYPFDRLIGDMAVRPAIDDGATLSELTAGWSEVAFEFRKQREPYLLYG